MFTMENKVTDSLEEFFKQLKKVRHELVGHLQGSAHLFPVLFPKKQVMVNGNSGLQVTILNATTHRDSVSYIAHTYHCTMDDKCMYIL